MAPTLFEKVQGGVLEIAKRQNFGYDPYDNYNGNSSWYNWGRWVALGCIIVVAVLFALLFSCFNARRRSRRGVQPMYGTGWLAGKPADGTHYGSHGQYANPAPPYSQQPQYTGQTWNSNEGYYTQQNGIELQQPQQAYHGNGGENVYGAPEGPPPQKEPRY